jgi:hypothetical protein
MLTLQDEVSADAQLVLQDVSLPFVREIPRQKMRSVAKRENWRATSTLCVLSGDHWQSRFNGKEANVVGLEMQGH